MSDTAATTSTESTNGRNLTGREIVFSMGWNMAGYMPDGDNVSVFTSAKDARVALADELDRFIDHEYDSVMLDNVSDDATSESNWAWEGQAYAEAARDMLARDSHAEMSDWVDSDGSVSVQVEDVRGYSHNYWVSALRLTDAYGSIESAGECAEWDDNTRYILNELEEQFHDATMALLGQETVSLTKVYRER